MTTVARVLVLQLVLSIMVAVGAGILCGAPAAKAAMLGGGSALAGTLAYAGCQRMVTGSNASQLIWGHVAGEAAKVLVALGLLAVVLVADPGHAAAGLAGFGATLLAYPLAIFWLNK
ncbi:MAG: ATP synthase subunit I [Burkholderiales bacterium]|nr:ATP synthase subunit I [Burkholderiales bacterium]